MLRKSRTPDKQARSFGTAELSAGGSRVAIIPALGGKIAAMELGGRQWLWTSDVMPYQTPVDGASYVETADSGGYDECFPTVGPCTLPASVTRYGGLTLPDHGELWSQPTSFVLETHPDRGGGETSAGTNGGALRAVTEWSGRRMPYRFAREIAITPDGAVVMAYTVTNEGHDRLPYIWSAHPLFPLTPDTRIVLPENSRTRVYAQHGLDLLGAGAEHRWPRLRTAKGEADLSVPDSVRTAYACKLFLDVSVGRAALVQGDARLEVEWDASQIPNVGVWINRRGWTPLKRVKPYLNLGLEPCIGAPDTLSDALGAWNAAHWLEAGETRQWRVVWRASPEGSGRGRAK